MQEQPPRNNFHSTLQSSDLFEYSVHLNLSPKFQVSYRVTLGQTIEIIALVQMKWWRGIFCLQWCCMKSSKRVSKLVIEIQRLGRLVFIRSFPWTKKIHLPNDEEFDLFLITHSPFNIFSLMKFFPSCPFSDTLIFIMRSCTRCRTSGTTALSSNPNEWNRFTSLRLNEHILSSVPITWTIGTNSVVQN